MKTIWVNGKNDTEKEEIEAAFKSSTTVRKRLGELLEAKEASNTSARLAISDYASPSWAYLQADSVGYSRAIREIISLIS